MFPVVQGFYNKFLNQVEALRGERTLAAEIGQCFLSLSLSVLKFNPFLITFLNTSYFFCFSNSYVNLVSVLSCIPVKGNLELPAAVGNWRSWWFHCWCCLNSFKKTVFTVMRFEKTMSWQRYTKVVCKCRKLLK